MLNQTKNDANNFMEQYLSFAVKNYNFFADVFQKNMVMCKKASEDMKSKLNLPDFELPENEYTKQFKTLMDSFSAPSLLPVKKLDENKVHEQFADMIKSFEANHSVAMDKNLTKFFAKLHESQDKYFKNLEKTMEQIKTYVENSPSKSSSTINSPASKKPE